MNVEKLGVAWGQEYEFVDISLRFCINLTGVMLSEPSVVSDPAVMKRLWVHEVMRVYYDRLVDDLDRTWIVDFLKETMAKSFNTDFDELFKKLDFDNDGNSTVSTRTFLVLVWLYCICVHVGVVAEDDLRSLMFCGFVDPKNEQKPYVEVHDVDKLRLVVENYLDEYNNISKKPMNLVMFR